MKGKKERIVPVITAVLLFVSCIILYMTHRKIPFMMDDLWYATMLSDETPITSLGDIVESQIWHYHNWGGRSITHGLLQIILLMGEHAADCLNVAVTFLLAWMICVVADCKRFLGFFAAFGMLFGLNANWKMSMFWQAGAANYLYITVFILLFLHCYLRELQPEDVGVKTLPGIVLWIIPLGLVAGWSNENMGPMAFLITLAVLVLLRKQAKPVKLWMILGNLSCLAGSVLVILAPGNFVRSSQVAEQEYGTLWKCFLRGYAESQALLSYLFPAVLIAVFMIVLSRGVLKIKLQVSELLLLAGALLSWGAMTLSPHYPDRATFGTMVLLICVILSVGRKIVDVRKDLDVMLWGISVLVWLRGMYWLGEYLAICWGWIR